MAGRLFGTDGVRGVANGDVLNPEVALSLGRASALFARERGAEQPVVVVGRDTRRSGPMLEDALCAGIAVGGRHRAARRRAADAGRRLARARAGREPRRRHLGLAQPVPRQRHQALRRGRLQARRRGGGPRRGADGRRRARGRPAPAWASRAGSRAPPSATRPGSPAAAARRSRCPTLRVLVDCANGAASTVAPLVFAQLGIEHEITACEPDGVNINDRVRLDAPRCARRARASRAASTSGSRSTATPTACSRSTRPARSWTATRSSPCSRATCRSPGSSPATRSSSRRCRTSASTARCASSASRPS